MNKIRIIPRLDIKGPNLVKGIHLEGLRVLGKPEEFAKYYYEQGADELMYMDVVASLYGRNSLFDLISKTARELFIPLTVGGGLKTIDDIKNVLRAGADKVSINTAAVKDPQIIREASLKFGSSTIVASIEVIKQTDGRYFVFTDNGREDTGLEAIAWAKKVEELGAGELVLTSVDNEGTGLGFDINLIKQVTEAVSIPVIAHGGAGNPAHIAAAIIQGGASAVAVASVLHYGYAATKAASSNSEQEGNTEFLRSGRGFSKIEPHTLPEIKDYLLKHNIETRITDLTL
jgi:cyclase